MRWIDSDSDTQFRRFVLQRNGDGFAARVESAPLMASTRLAGGVIHSSLFAATDMARIPDAVAIQVAEIFGSDIDFHRALRKGDRFSIVYETLEADGEPMRAGRVLSAEFVNAGKSFQAVWFQEPGSKGAYYGFDGNSRQHAFLGGGIHREAKPARDLGRVIPETGLAQIEPGHLGPPSERLQGESSAIEKLAPGVR